MTTFSRAFLLAHHIFPKGGTCLEFGVFEGNTFCWQAQQMLSTYRRSTLIGFDSWRGLPAEASGVWTPQRHAEGQFTASRGAVEKQLAKIGAAGDRFRLVDGFFRDSLTPTLQADIHDLIFVNIDVDLCSSSLELLGFIRPLLRPGVVLYWDDWKDPNDENPEPWGEHRAWAEWYPARAALKVETLEVNPVNQRSMLVVEADGKALSHAEVAVIRYKLLNMAG